jgi:hypothetical protein
MSTEGPKQVEDKAVEAKTEEKQAGLKEKALELGVRAAYAADPVTDRVRTNPTTSSAVATVVAGVALAPVAAPTIAAGAGAALANAAFGAALYKTPAAVRGVKRGISDLFTAAGDLYNRVVKGNHSATPSNGPEAVGSAIERAHARHASEMAKNGPRDPNAQLVLNSEASLKAAQEKIEEQARELARLKAKPAAAPVVVVADDSKVVMYDPKHPNVLAASQKEGQAQPAAEQGPAKKARTEAPAAVTPAKAAAAKRAASVRTSPRIDAAKKAASVRTSPRFKK